MARRDFDIAVHQPARVQVSTYYYPHWIARLDGREIAVDVNHTAGPGQGLMMFDLPAGNHQLTLDFEVQAQGGTRGSQCVAGFLVDLCGLEHLAKAGSRLAISLSINPGGAMSWILISGLRVRRSEAMLRAAYQGAAVSAGRTASTWVSQHNWFVSMTSFLPE